MSDLEKLRDEVEGDRRQRAADGTWDGKYQLSTFADVVRPPESDERLDVLASRVVMSARKLPKNYRATTVPILLAHGFEIGASPPDPYHYDVSLGATVTEAVLQRFVACFDPVVRSGLWNRQQA